MGPSIDLPLRRHLSADPVLLISSLRRLKLKKSLCRERILGKEKKDFEVDEMGGLRRRVRLGKRSITRLRC
jgi:hypothetical protein